MVQTDSVQTGSIQTGSVQTGSVQTGSVQTGSVQTGSVQTGSVQTGSVQTGSVQTGSVGNRLGFGFGPTSGSTPKKGNHYKSFLIIIRLLFQQLFLPYYKKLLSEMESMQKFLYVFSIQLEVVEVHN